LRPRFDKLIVHAPQLGDVRAALYSVVLTHEEKNNFFAGITGKRNLAASILWQFEIGRGGADSEFSGFHNNPFFSFIQTSCES
jgi:hypothetical protein